MYQSVVGGDFFRGEASGSGSQPQVTRFFTRTNKLDDVDDACAAWIFSAGIPFNAVRNPKFKEFICKVRTAGASYTPITSDKLRTELLDRAHASVEARVKSIMETTRKYGGTVCCDGWRDAAGRPLLNATFACPTGAFMVCAWDSSTEVKTAEYIADKLTDVINDIGADKVVQVIMDNAANCVAAGKVLEARFEHITFSPCMAHTLDLMLEDWGQMDFIDELVQKGRDLVTWINGADAIRTAFTKHTNGQKLTKWVATRFATSFLMLESLVKHRASLERTVVDPLVKAYVDRYPAKKAAWLQQKNLVLDREFWKEVTTVLKVLQPAFKLLRMVDGDFACISKVYVHMHRVGEELKNAEGLTAGQRREMLKVHSDRWEDMCSDLQRAAYVLDYEFQQHDLESNSEVMDAFWRVVEKLLPTEDVDKIVQELPDFRAGLGSVGTNIAKRSAPLMEPAKWWNNFGSSYPTLQKLAMLVLSQCASSSSCERNWSNYGFIHCPRRSRLTAERAKKLVYVFANERILTRQGVMEAQKKKNKRVVAWRDSDTEAEEEEEVVQDDLFDSDEGDHFEFHDEPELSEGDDDLEVDGGYE